MLLWVWLTFSLAGPDAQSVMLKHCGTCHDGALPTAKPPALRVFNLRDLDWPTRLSDERLEKIAKRLRKDATAEERALVDELIKAERERRAGR